MTINKQSITSDVAFALENIDRGLGLMVPVKAFSTLEARAAIINKAPIVNFFKKKLVSAGYDSTVEAIETALNAVAPEVLIKAAKTHSLQPLTPAIIDGVKHSNFKPYTSKNGKITDKVTLINLDSSSTGSKVDSDELIGSSSYERVDLQLPPLEVSVKPETRYAGIETIGRNLNYYHFTGAEKLLEFEVDWYAEDKERLSVIQKCQKLESYSLANGYSDNPPRIYIQWGNQNTLFRDSIWVLLKAPYTLSQFQKATIYGYGKAIKNGLLPAQAKQNLTFGKIGVLGNTNNLNLSWDQITGETSDIELEIFEY